MKLNYDLKSMTNLTDVQENKWGMVHQGYPALGSFTEYAANAINSCELDVVAKWHREALTVTFNDDVQEKYTLVLYQQDLRSTYYKNRDQYKSSEMIHLAQVGRMGGKSSNKDYHPVSVIAFRTYGEFAQQAWALALTHHLRSISHVDGEQQRKNDYSHVRAAYASSESSIGVTAEAVDLGLTLKRLNGDVSAEVLSDNGYKELRSGKNPFNQRFTCLSVDDDAATMFMLPENDKVWASYVGSDSSTSLYE